jgi:hypothetical protein
MIGGRFGSTAVIARKKMDTITPVHRHPGEGRDDALINNLRSAESFTPPRA